MADRVAQDDEPKQTAQRHKLAYRCALAALAIAAGVGLIDARRAMAKSCDAAFEVALDVGHTLSQPGATGASGQTEFSYNRRLADAVEEALKREGVRTVVIGRMGGPMRLAERTRLAKAAGASLLLSLHHDSVQPRYLRTETVEGRTQTSTDRFNGYSLFVSGGNADPTGSEHFAEALGRALVAAGFAPSLHHAEPIPGEGRPLIEPTIGLYRFDGLVVLRTATMPAVLLEAAVIVNPAEERRVRDPAVLDRMARAIAGSVVEYCGGTSGPKARR